MIALGGRHLDGCVGITCEDLAADRGEARPKGVTDFTWSGVHFTRCEEDCPVLHERLEWARERWRELGITA